MSSWQPPADYQKRPVTVLGGGVLGRRIASTWLAGGWDVVIRDPSADQRKQAEEYVRENIGRYTVLTSREAGKLSTTDELKSAVKDAWLVVESVPEKLQLKVDTFAELEKIAASDALLGSNSSSYKSSEVIAKISVETKKRVFNIHYMSPPDYMIVELMTDGHTHPEIFPWLIERAREAGLHPIHALNESTGFVFNRVWAAIKREVLHVLQEKVSTPAVVDSVFREMYNAKEGPCQMMDNVGLDTVSLIEKHYTEERHLETKHLEWLDSNYVSSGKLGTKTPAKGGLYELPKPGSQTQLIFLDLGLAEPLDDKLSLHEVMHRGSIMSYNVDKGGPKAVQLLSHDYMPDGIDVADGRMYWTHMGTPNLNDGSVFSAKLDGSDVQTVVATGEVHTPKQLVVDEEAKKLYFNDREGGRVLRVDFDGKNLETLVQTGDWKAGKLEQTLWPVGITVSKKHNKIYWTQKGNSKATQGRIFSAGLDSPKDPSNRSDIELVIGNLPEPIDLELDDENDILYWTDRGELPLGNTLNRKHLYKTDVAAEKKLGRQILAQGLCEGIGLKLDKLNDCIWVADMGGHIWKCNPHRPAFKEKVFESPTSAYTGLALIRV